MKFRASEVTNSSSTSFMVFIPEKLEIQKFLHLIPEQSKKDYKEWITNEDPEAESLEDMVVSQFGLIASDVMTYCEDGVEYIAYWAVLDILEELELVIRKWDSSMGCGAIFNISNKEIQDKIDQIVDGQWGIRHGGWGSKDGETI